MCRREPGPAVTVALSSTRWSTRELALTGATTFAVAGVAMAQTLSIPLLPVLARQFDTDLATVSWVATGTLIASAVVNPVVGRMGDMYGKRRMVFVCLGLALAGSVMAAMVVDHLLLLVVARVVQGMSAGLIPLTFGILRDELSARHVAHAGSVVMVGGAAVGAGLGPIVMGTILDRWGVAAVFWVSSAVFVVAIGLMIVCTRPSTTRFPAAFDVVGSIGLSIVLVTTMLGITKGPQWGWTSPSVIGLLMVGVVFGIAWYRWERRVPEPVVDLAVSTRGPVRVAHLGGVIAGVSSFSQYIFVFTLVSLPASTGHGLGRSLGVAGLVQLPGVVVLGISILVASKITARVGALHVVITGGLVIAAGFVLGAVRHGSIGELVISVIVVNAGLGPLFCALPTLILHSVDVSETSAVNAVNALSRLTGSVVASALAASILATGTVVVAGVEYPAEWTFVAVYLLAGLAAMAMAAAAAHARNHDRSCATLP